MNKRSWKTKGLSRRLIAWLLCCVCLLGVAPISAIALEADATPVVEETATVEPKEEATTAPEVTATASPTSTALSISTDTSVEIDSSETETPADTVVPETTVTAEPTSTAAYTNPEDTSAGTSGSEPEMTTEVETDTTVAPETTPEATLEPAQEETPNPQSFYDCVMAADSCCAMYELISDDANYDAASALSIEQVHAIKAKAQSLEDDGYQEILVQTLNELLKFLGEDIDSEYGIQLDGDINISMYKNTIPVYWDTVTALSQSASSASGANVQTVTLGGSNVTYGNADTTSWSGGSTLSTYFSGASANNMKDATMSITAAKGYYVTGIVVACAPKIPSGTLSPFKCGTWSDGNEFIQTFNLTNSTYSNGQYTLSFSINSKYFSHNGATAPSAYFILIQVAAVPTPLYVEYNYGNVADFLTVDSNSAFYNPSWTVVASGNNYGNGAMYTSGVLTSNTQFAYQYPSSDTSVIANWTHTANSVSSEALAEAAAAGYYFAGWSVTWYNSCSVSNTKNSYNDNYTMSFSNTYMTGSYAPGDAVQLPTNVRLVAQWKPITLKVTKSVSGLTNITEHANKGNTYTLLLQNMQNGEYVQLQSKDYTITGDGTLSYTFAASDADVTQVITPGTYKVVETGTYDLTGSSENAYCTTTYPSETVTVGTDGTVQELKVLNTYSSTPAAYTLTVRKTLSGNMYDPDGKFAFTVTYGDSTETFQLGNNETKTITIPVGVAVSVTEDAGGYTYSLTSVDPSDLNHTELSNGISFTMPASNVSVEINNAKDITIDTGVILDTLPYVLILAVVVIGVMVLMKRRRNRDDD